LYCLERKYCIVSTVAKTFNCDESLAPSNLFAIWAAKSPNSIFLVSLELLSLGRLFWPLSLANPLKVMSAEHFLSVQVLVVLIFSSPVHYPSSRGCSPHRWRVFLGAVLFTSLHFLICSQSIEAAGMSVSYFISDKLHIC